LVRLAREGVKNSRGGTSKPAANIGTSHRKKDLENEGSGRHIKKRGEPWEGGKMKRFQKKGSRVKKKRTKKG